MRLTLRTLLAYLDDLLEPSQAKELGAKVQESEMAAGLVMKIRDVIRKRRLTAPVVSGPGCDLDANIVAEYLDNTLPPDGVTDLERLCLESDIHLAEVAASHQILTLVLGEPVDIGSLSRERMYALGEAAKSTAAAPTPVPATNSNGNGHGNGVTVTAKPPATTPATSAAINGLGPAVKAVSGSRPSVSTIPVMTAAPATTVEKKPDESFDHTIPDYLKAPPFWKRALPVAIALLVVVWLGMLFSDREMLLSIMGVKPTSPPQVAGGNVQPDGVEPDLDAKPESKQPDEDKPEESGSVEEPAIDEMPPEKVGGEQVAVVDKANVDPQPPADADDFVPTLAPAPETEPGKATDPKTSSNSKPNPDNAVAKVDTHPANGKAKPPETKTAPAAPQPAPAAVRSTPALYVSQDGIVLHYDADRQGWYQLPHLAHVFADDALAVPEPFDAQLQLGREKHRLTVMGPAIMGITDPTDEQPMGVNVQRGRVVLQPTALENAAAKSPMSVMLSIHGTTWRLDLTDPATRCGIEVMPREPHQFEEPFSTANWSGNLYLWSGSLQITNSEGMVHSMLGPDTFVLAKDPSAADAAPASKDLPNWDRRLPTIAQKNARLFEDQFTADVSSARDALLGLVDDKVYKPSELAVSCLGLIGDYDMMLEVLDRNQHYESRKAAINSLRDWINQAADHRDKLKEAIALKYHPDDAEAIYRLIWGYQEQDLRSKQTSEQLVDWLEHPQLPVRELAWFYIKSLSPRKQVLYDAAATPADISTKVERIRKMLDKEGTLLPPLRAKPAAPGTFPAKGTERREVP